MAKYTAEFKYEVVQHYLEQSYLFFKQNIWQLEQAIHDYIAYYNNERIQTKLKGLSPVRYKAQSLNT